MGTPAAPWRPHWSAYLAEFAGTALLVFLGLGAVIADFTPLSPVVRLLPDPFARRLLTGFLFGSVGAGVALSPLGRISGAHLDPVLTWAFWLSGSFGARDSLLYTLAQFLGAIVGALALVPVWGSLGAAVGYGATAPGPQGAAVAVAGELLATFALVGGIVWFVGHERLRRFTPFLIPPLVALLVGFEAPWSGTSMNPARSLGPAIAAHAYAGLWVYFVGPALGAAVASLAATRSGRVHVAKIAHHAHDPLDRFHGPAHRAPVLRLRRPRGRRA